VTDDRLELIGNRRHSEGMGTSLAQGASACSWGTDAIVVALADAPFFRVTDLDRLIDVQAEAGGIVAPVFEGRRGHPVVLDAAFREELEGLSGDTGARRILENNEDRVREVELDDDAFLVDVDDPEDYVAVKDGIESR
jgi:molybdenum cofactor cytidylyltransferase